MCIATMRTLKEQIKVLDKQTEQIFAIIHNTVTSVTRIGKVHPAGIIAEIGNVNRFQSQASVVQVCWSCQETAPVREFEA